MNIDSLVLCIIISIMFFVLIKEWLLPELAVFLALAAIILLGILEPGEALIGFSNSGVHTVALLLIIAATVSKTGILGEIFEKILGKNKSMPLVLFRLMLPVSSLSAFMNNTPIVTMLIPTIQHWAITNHIRPSKLLIPLSYATILGGTITLIGTSTNLIVQGFLIERGIDEFHLFDFSIFGIPIALAGILYMVVVGHYALPNRKDNTESFTDEKRNYLFEFIVDKTSKLVGKTIEEAQLRHLQEIFLVQIIRNDRMIVPAPNDYIIQAEDTLVFSGSRYAFQQILQINGLTLSKDSSPTLNNGTLYEVVISNRSPLLYKKIKESNFRSKYNAAIVAVKRKNKQITSGIGNIILKRGDSLILLANHDFSNSWGDSVDFHLVSPIKMVKRSTTFEKVMIIGILTGFILTSIFQLLSIFQLCLLSTSLILLTRTLSISDAKKAISWDVIILMGCSIGIGEAIEKTGLAISVASFLTKLQPHLGIVGIIIAFYFITMIMTEVLNNLATAAFMFPIGFSIAQQINVEPIMFAMLTAIAASCSFLTPIGYQTNLLVYGPGGYKFTDYIKVGLPLSFICMSITIFIACLKWL